MDKKTLYNKDSNRMDRKTFLMFHTKLNIRIGIATILFLCIFLFMNHYIKNDINQIISLRLLGISDEKVTRLYQEEDVYGGDKYYLHLKGISDPLLDDYDAELQLVVADYSSEISLMRFLKELNINNDELKEILSGNIVERYQKLTDWNVDIAVYRKGELFNYYYFYHNNRIVKLRISDSLEITDAFKNKMIDILRSSISLIVDE